MLKFLRQVPLFGVTVFLAATAALTGSAIAPGSAPWLVHAGNGGVDAVTQLIRTASDDTQFLLKTVDAHSSAARGTHLSQAHAEEVRAGSISVRARLNALNGAPLPERSRSFIDAASRRLTSLRAAEDAVTYRFVSHQIALARDEIDGAGEIVSQVGLRKAESRPALDAPSSTGSATMIGIGGVLLFVLVLMGSYFLWLRRQSMTEAAALERAAASAKPATKTERSELDDLLSKIGMGSSVGRPPSGRLQQQ